jgi:hypothetical protein
MRTFFRAGTTLLSKNQQTVLTHKMKGLEGFALKLEAQLKEESRNKLLNSLKSDDGIVQTFCIYSRDQFYKLFPEGHPLMDELYAIQGTQSFGGHTNDEFDEISFLDFDESRMQQVRLQQKSNSDWDLMMANLAVAGELFGERWAKKNNLSYQDLSGKNPYSKVDALIETVPIDFKTKCGSRVSGDLSSRRWDGEEKLMLIQASSRSFNSQSATCRLMGIFDSNLLQEEGLVDLIKGFCVFTPPFFMNARSYFLGEQTDDFARSILIDSFRVHAKLKNYTRIRAYAGASEYFKTLGQAYPEIQDLCCKLSRIHSKGRGFMSPLIILGFIVESFKSARKVDTDFIREAILECVELNMLQKSYLCAALKTLKIYPNLKCRFTNRPLSDGAILFRSGVLSVEVEEGKRNTLIAYSRYSGEMVDISDDPVCQDISGDRSCACLLSFHKEIYFGRSSCPAFGIERDKELFGRKKEYS